VYAGQREGEKGKRKLSKGDGRTFLLIRAGPTPSPVPGELSSVKKWQDY